MKLYGIVYVKYGNESGSESDLIINFGRRHQSSRMRDEFGLVLSHRSQLPVSRFASSPHHCLNLRPYFIKRDL
jgi:hypothetical protein